MTRHAQHVAQCVASNGDRNGFPKNERLSEATMKFFYLHLLSEQTMHLVNALINLVT